MSDAEKRKKLFSKKSLDSPDPHPGSELLLEDGFYLLQEDEDAILLE